MTLEEKMLKKIDDNEAREKQIYVAAKKRGIWKDEDILTIHLHELSHMATETLLIRELLEI